MPGYQLAFLIPGSMPVRAISLKHILHRPANLMYARGRPQRLQRLYSRTLYFLGLFQLAIFDAFANVHRPPCGYRRAASDSDLANGIPISSRRRNPSLSVLAVVVITTWRPRILSMEL